MSTTHDRTDRIDRRRFLHGAAATAGAVALGGALPTLSRAAPRAATVTLSYWNWYTSQNLWVDDEIKRFEQAHPGVKVTRQSYVTDQYANIFSTAVNAGTEPDVFLIPHAPGLNEQVANGWLLPLDKWAGATWRARFPAGCFYEGSNIFGGKLYTAPFQRYASMYQLYINNAVFRQAGLTNHDGSIALPRTWDDVTRCAETITKKSNGRVYGLGFGDKQGFILGWWLDLFVRGAGAPGGATGMDYRTGTWTYATDRGYVDVIDLLLSWKSKGYVYPYAMSTDDETARVAFEQGKFGMTVGGVWNQSEWTQHGFTDYSLMTLPAPSLPLKGYFYTVPGGVYLAISATTRHPDEAWAWFDWTYSLATGRRWVEKLENLSVFPQDNDPRSLSFKPFADYVATNRYTRRGPDPTLRNPETAYVIQKATTPSMNDILAGIYSGQIAGRSAIWTALAQLAAENHSALTTGIAQAQQQGHKVSLGDYIVADWDITRHYVSS